MSTLGHNTLKDFLGKVGGTFLTRIVVMGVALFVSVFIARILGPEGQGVYATAVALGFVSVQFASLGMSTSNTYLSAKSDTYLSRLFGNSILTTIFSGSSVFLIMISIKEWFPSLIPIEGPLFYIAALWAFPGLILLYCQSLILGLQKVRFYNFIDISHRVIHVFFLVGLFYLHIKSVEAFYMAFVIAYLLIAFVTALSIFIFSGGKIPIPSFALLRASALYGFSAYLAGLFSFLCLRFDLLMLKAMTDSTETGFYSIAVSLADVVYTLPVVTGTILFAKLSSLNNFDEKKDFVFRVIGILSLLMCAGVALAYFLVVPFIPLLYGVEYEPSILPFQYLLPGIFCLSLSTMAQNFLASIGRSWLMFIGPLIALLLNLILNYLWIPIYGKEGAAWASTASYALWLVIAILILWRIRSKVERKFDLDFAPRDYLLSVYSMTDEIREELSRKLNKNLEVIEISTLVRSLGVKKIFFHLIRKNISRLYFYNPPGGGNSLIEIICAFSLVANAKELILIEAGKEVTYSRRGMFRAVWSLVKASILGKFTVSKKKKELQYLLKQDRIEVESSLGSRVFFLKANLWFGVKAGGSVGHVAGVINAFVRMGKQVVAAAISRPLMIRDDVEYLPLPYNRTFAYPVEVNNYLYGQDVDVQLKNDRSLRERTDFIYQRLSLGNYSGVFASRDFRKPLILEYNGSEVWVSANWGKKLKYHDLADLCEQVCLKHAHLIVTVSDVLKEELIEKGIEPRRIVSYPNCIDPNIFDPQKFSEAEILDLKEKYELTPEDRVVTFIGTFGKWHGIRVLADSIKAQVENHSTLLEECNIKFLLVGDGSEMPYIRELLSSPDCQKYVRFTGLVEQHLAPLHLAASDILVSPHVPNEDGTRFFGSPTKLFEYMAMKKPIVASNLEQLGDIFAGSVLMKDDLREDEIQKSSALLVRPNDIGHFTEALIYLYKNSQLYGTLGENARQLALEKYTWDIHVAKIVEAYNKGSDR